MRVPVRPAEAGSAGRRAGVRCVSAFLLAVLPLSACYQTLPLADSTPAPGTRVMAQLTREGSAQMAPWIGAGASAVEGIVLDVQPAEWQLSVLRVEQVVGTDVVWNREAVRFPASALATVSERRFEKQRSYLAAGLITVGLVVLGRVFANSVFSGSDGSGQPPPPPQ